MRRSRIIFLLIVGSAILLVVIAQITQRLPTPLTATARPTLQIEIAVNPLAFAWVSEQATAFNAQSVQADGQTVQVRITQRDGIDIWQTGGVWSAASHPAAWIPEAGFTLTYAADVGLRYETLSPSLANTSLVWGIFSDRADSLGKSIDWETLQQAAVKNTWRDLNGQEAWGFVKPAFALPQRSTAGFGVLISAAAAYSKNGTLSASGLADAGFQNWLKPVAEAVPNFASLGQDPAAVLASRGASVADFALLPESAWLTAYSQITARQPIRLAYPTYKLTFDMPLAIWYGPETTAAERSAVRQFASFLEQESAQKQAAAYGLRPAKLSLSSVNAPLFSAAVSAGLTLDTAPGTPIQVPPRPSALGVLNWFKSIRSS